MLFLLENAAIKATSAAVVYVNKSDVKILKNVLDIFCVYLFLNILNLCGLLSYGTFIRAAENFNDRWASWGNIKSIFSEDILKFTFKYKILDFEIFGMKQERNFNSIMAVYALLIL